MGLDRWLFLLRRRCLGGRRTSTSSKGNPVGHSGCWMSVSAGDGLPTMGTNERTNEGKIKTESFVVTTRWERWWVVSTASARRSPEGNYSEFNNGQSTALSTMHSRQEERTFARWIYYQGRQSIGDAESPPDQGTFSPHRHSSLPCPLLPPRRRKTTAESC